MPSLTIENYVKTIYLLAEEAAGGAVATGQIADALTVLPGTVTSMLKTLDESGLATYTPYEGVRLTPAGRALALRVLRRHRLIEQFLSQTLDLNWDEVHEEAEHMEHAVSDALVDRIDEYLGRPATDPHGDPIPQADGTMAAAADRPLAECAVGERFCIARVTDQSPEFLRYLSRAGLEIGTVGALLAIDPVTGELWRVTDRAELVATVPREPDGHYVHAVWELPDGAIWILLFNIGPMKHTYGFTPRPPHFELRDDEVRALSCGLGFDGWNLTFEDHGSAVQALIGLGKGARKSDVTKLLDELVINSPRVRYET